MTTKNKEYVIISKGISNKFAQDSRYRYKGLIFCNKEKALNYFNSMPYETQRNQKVVLVRK